MLDNPNKCYIFYRTASSMKQQAQSNRVKENVYNLSFIYLLMMWNIIQVHRPTTYTVVYWIK